MKTVDFSETIAASDLKGSKIRYLKNGGGGGGGVRVDMNKELNFL